MLDGICFALMKCFASQQFYFPHEKLLNAAEVLQVSLLAFYILFIYFPLLDVLAARATLRPRVHYNNNHNGIRLHVLYTFIQYWYTGIHQAHDDSKYKYKIHLLECKKSFLQHNIMFYVALTR